MQETWVQSLDQEDPLEKEMAAHSSILTWRISMDRGAWGATVHGVAKSRTRLNDFTFRVGVDIIIIEIKCTTNVMHLNYPQTIFPALVHRKIVFYETGPWCQKGWGLLA